MKKPIIRMTRQARKLVANPEQLIKAAITAHQKAGGGNIHFIAFRSHGRQFALCSRTVIEVDWFPNRVPKRVLRKSK